MPGMARLSPAVAEPRYDAAMLFEIENEEV
jgi:hypothetical protein